MNLLRLYIENFMCHEYSYIDFSQFSSALILGKVENNDLYSNGVGKTTIFKAIEYVLFNQADVNLEKIIRDDAPNCKITLDFTNEDKEYRVVRTRTRKGATDISLYERNAVAADILESHHVLNDKKYPNIYCAIVSDKYWKDISGRRAADTEKDLNKLLKINFKSFRSTVHFLQNDFSGLTTATPEKRKGILKEALNLAIYSKMEKLAKDKANGISKDIDKHKTIIETLGDPDQELTLLNEQLTNTDNALDLKNIELTAVSEQISNQTLKINNLNTQHASLESKFIELVNKEKALVLEKNKLEISVKEYTTKKSNIIKSANELVSELKILKEEQLKLTSLDYSQIDVWESEINIKKEEQAIQNGTIQSLLLKIEELKVPFPDDAKCRHCRQTLSAQHKSNCLDQINKELKENQDAVLKHKKIVSDLNAQVANIQQSIIKLNLSKQQLEGINSKISVKNKEITDKKSLHAEYVDLLGKFQLELKEKMSELESVQEELKNSSKEEADNLKSLIKEEGEKLLLLNNNMAILNKEITNIANTKAIITHNIGQKNKDKNNKVLLEKSLQDLNTKYGMYPSVLQAFSSVGIPNLIIQNVLDDLQVEANNLLNQLKPSLQLSFFVEKTKADGTESDTLDINYFLNGKERQYEQLSGAQKLAVTFSLKLGLSFLLQKMIGTDIKFLLLDEIDQSLDKASVDAFADIVKFFQKDFTILIITHNDRLKDKFKHIILVEQDTNMVSRAQVFNN